MRDEVHTVEEQGVIWLSITDQPFHCSDLEGLWLEIFGSREGGYKRRTMLALVGISRGLDASSVSMTISLALYPNCAVYKV